tara:strand:+ start:8516 stop:9490 length:975 start_codon:yes stop_codon:yes gene_type:complete
MAYVDLVSTGVTPVAGGSTYNFSYDTPISADGSPHLTHIGFQIDATLAGAGAFNATIGRLINNMRIKIGANTILDFNDPFVDTDGVTPSNLSVLAQKVRGVDSIQLTAADGSAFLGELALPFGLDASRSHRVNFSITLGSETAYTGQAFDVAQTEFNVVNYYGTASDSTLYGSRQDFTLTNGSERAITVFGKKNWQMLGVSMINDTDADEVSQIRVNNGAFRALRIQQWRILDSTYLNGIRTLQGGETNVPAWTLSRAGYVFLDLKRLTAGANIDMTVTATANTTMSFFPIWVAPLNQRTSVAPSQTQKTVSSTAADVEAESFN